VTVFLHPVEWIAFQEKRVCPRSGAC